MSGPGNSRLPAGAGFTLVELLLVVAIIAMAGAGVSLAVRDDGQSQLERDAQRLMAMLESARAQSRSSGLPVVWRATEGGFEFVGLVKPIAAERSAPASDDPDKDPTVPWLSAQTSAPDGASLSLGPEPIIGRQSLLLRNGRGSVRIASDGLRPFAAQSADRTPDP